MNHTPSRRVRVLRVMDKLGHGDRLHGPGRMWLNTLHAFDRNRFDVTACVLRTTPAIRSQFEAEGVALRHLPHGRLSPRTLLTLCRLIREERIDLLHLHGFGATTFGRMAARITGVPAVTHHHDLEFGPWYVPWIDRWLAPATARAIAVSRSVAEACRARRHLPLEGTVVVPNAVHDRWLAPVPAARREHLRRVLGIPPDAPVVGSVTRFDPVKDLPLLLDTIPRLRSAPPPHLLLVGDGGGRPALERRIRELGLSRRAHCVGFQAEAQPYVALMDVVVVCSLHEGFSTALLEAMAMGRPVVATDTGGMRELVRDGWNGLLVPPHDRDRLAEAVQRLIDAPELASRLGAQARRDAMRFTIPAHVSRIEEVYEDVLRERERR
jgi:glycosyltransferase involved in cell wall biosynthesis